VAEAEDLVGKASSGLYCQGLFSLIMMISHTQKNLDSGGQFTGCDRLRRSRCSSSFSSVATKSSRRFLSCYAAISALPPS